MIVIDASALVELISGGRHGRTVGAILTTDGDWWAPEHLVVEVLSGLRGLWLGGGLTVEGFAAAAEQLAQSSISSYRTVDLLPRIVELAGRMTSYDAAYVALAEKLDCPLVTLDRRLRSVAGVSCAFLPTELPTG